MATKKAESPVTVTSQPISPEVARGSYAVALNAVASAHETILDFVMVDPSTFADGKGKGYVVSRVIVANTNLPTFAKALNDLVDGLPAR